MDAWTDEGRIYLLDQGPVPTLSVLHEDDAPPERSELDTRMVMIDATSILLERSRFEAATALHACQLDLVIGAASPYGDAPVWVNLKAPPELVFTLENMERDVAWFVREAISEALPHGYEVSEFVVQARVPTSPYGGEGRAAA
ncbi:MAG: hypothetical protein ABSC51_08690 [Gaiellaceae bacterium]|jgi:hypothetical protein